MLDKMNNFLPRLWLQPTVSSLDFTKHLSPLHGGPHSVQIGLAAAGEKVTLSATAESNYHVLNGSTPPHLHPPLFLSCRYLLWRCIQRLQLSVSGRTKLSIMHTTAAKIHLFYSDL